MYAIVQIGSAQYKISEGDVIDVHRLDKEKGKSITLDKVLLFSKGTDVRIGQPFLKDIKVTAKVVDHLANKRVVSLKYRRRTNSATKWGQRLKLTALNITKIAV